MQCLEFLGDYFAKHGRFPTHREIAAGLNLQSTTVSMHLEPLRRKGMLRRVRRAHRNYRITRLGWSMHAAMPSVKDAGTAPVGNAAATPVTAPPTTRRTDPPEHGLPATPTVTP